MTEIRGGGRREVEGKKGMGGEKEEESRGESARKRRTKEKRTSKASKCAPRPRGTCPIWFGLKLIFLERP